MFFEQIHEVTAIFLTTSLFVNCKMPRGTHGVIQKYRGIH